jgi:hypothetical protein
LDHIEPKCKPARGLGGIHSWANFAGSCTSCNGRKGANSLLMFLAVNAGCRGATLKPTWAERYSPEFTAKYSEAA